MFVCSSVQHQAILRIQMAGFAEINVQTPLTLNNMQIPEQVDAYKIVLRDIGVIILQTNVFLLVHQGLLLTIQHNYAWLSAPSTRTPMLTCSCMSALKHALTTTLEAR